MAVLFFAPVFLVFAALAVLASVASVFIFGTTMVKGVLRSRFSLRTLMITVFCGGACVAMVMDHEHVPVLIVGTVCSTIYVTALASYLLSVGGAPKNAESNAPENRGTV